MNRGLISVVSVLTEDRLGANTVGSGRGAAASALEMNHQRLPDVGSSDNERMRYQHWASDASMLTESETTPKAVKFSHRSLWCCFFLIMPIVIPVLIYIKDSDVTRRIFLGFFIVVLIILLVCFSLVIFQTRTRQMLSMRHNSCDNDHAGLQSVRSTLPPPDRNFLAATHHILTSHRIRSAYRVARSDPMSPPGQVVRFQSPLHSQGIASPNRLAYSSLLRTVASAPSTPCSASSPLITATNDLPQPVPHHSHYLSSFHSAVATSREGLALPLSWTHDNPPPYHVAINLPAPESVDSLVIETPPPPYENAMD